MTANNSTDWKLKAFIVIVAFVLTISFAKFYAWHAFTISLTLIICGIIYLGWSPLAINIAKWFGRPQPSIFERIGTILPTFCYCILLLVLSNYYIKENRKEEAMRKAEVLILEEIESGRRKQEIANTEKAKIEKTESLKKINTANLIVQKIVSESQSHFLKGDLENAQASLEKALHVHLANDFASARTLEKQITAERINSANIILQQFVFEGQLYAIKNDLDSAQLALDKALHVPLANDFISARTLEKQIIAGRINSANIILQQLAFEGHLLAIKNDLDGAQLALEKALHVPLAIDFEKANELANEISKGRTLIAKALFEKREFEKAKEEVLRAIHVPTSMPTEDAKKLLVILCNQEVAMFVATARKLLANKDTDGAFDLLSRAIAVKDATEIQDAQQLLSPILKERSRQQSEIDNKRLKAVLAEIVRKKEEEYNVNDLVLMLKTCKGVSHEYGGEITGIIVNKRKSKIRYVQITFNIYDVNGYRVGTAIANINDLASGEEWKFDASCFGKRFSSYKLDELIGF